MACDPPRSEREASFEPGELGLVGASVAEWGPFVFVNADPAAAPLDDALGPVPELLERGGAHVDGLVFRERSEYELAANWKVAVENYLECYHCAVAHPGFTRLVDVDPDAYVLEAGNGRWSQYGRARNGEGSCRFHLVWPALKINVYPGSANFSIGPVWPEGPERTAVFLDYFFGEGVSDEEAAELMAFHDQVGREDTALVESVQRGVRSGLIEGGKLLVDSEHLHVSFQERVRSTVSEPTL